MDYTFLEYIGQPSIALDSEFRILYSNSYAQDRFRSRANVEPQPGKPFLDLFDGHSQKAVALNAIQQIQKLESIGQNTLHGYKLDITKDFTLLISVQKNTLPDGETFWILTGVNTTRQIEEVRKNQARFQEQLEMYRILFEMAPVGLAIKDLEGGFYKANRGLCEITGYDRFQLMDLQPEDIFPDTTRVKEELLIQEMIAKHENVFRSERLLKRSNGESRIVSETLHIINDELNQPYFIIVSYLDITEEKDLQKRLLEARKMEEIGKLSGGIAHDFNNMLLPVMLCSDIALQELKTFSTPTDSKISKIINYIEKISISAQRAKALIQKLFQYSQSGIYELMPIYLDNEVKLCIPTIQADIPQHIQLLWEITEEKCPILGEPTGIFQILDNLVSNAIHSMKFRDAGTIAIRVFNDLEDIALEVEDQGDGISDENLEKIFQPFYTQKSPGEGTGMGLTLVHTIVHKMNGKCQVFSQIGKGTRIRIVFPAWQKIQTEPPRNP